LGLHSIVVVDYPDKVGSVRF